MKKIFSVGDVVVAVLDGELKKGKVINLYEDLDMSVVNLEDGRTEKIPLNRLTIYKGEDDKDQVKEPVEKSEITITPDEFRDIAMRVIMKETEEHNPIVSMAFAIFVIKLHRALFFDEIDND